MVRPILRNTQLMMKPEIFHPYVIQMNEALTSDFVDPIRPQSKK